MAPFLDEAGGYTPVPDVLVKQYDFTTAYVWGIVWRYTQMENGICKASQNTIADRAGMSRRTVVDCMNILTRDGYLDDLTPDAKGIPHHYSTKKGEEKIKQPVQNLHNPINESSAEFAQLNGQPVQNLHTTCENSAQPPVQNLHTKKVFKETIKESVPKTILPGPVSQALLEICRLDWDYVDSEPSLQGPFKRIIKFLDSKEACADEIREFDIWRKNYHWTGKDGSAPTFKQVGELWGQYREWVDAGRINGNQQKVSISAK